MASTIILITGKHGRHELKTIPLTDCEGANSGVGFAASKTLLCASDVFHIIMAGRSVEKVKAAMSEIENGGINGSLSAMQLDVTDEKSVKEAAGHVQQQFGRLVVLVNNAAVAGIGLDVKTSFQRCMETNVMDPALVSEAFRPLLFKSQNPYSVYVGSGGRTLTRNATQLSVGHENIRGGGAYQVSKAALNVLALLDFRDNGPKGLKVFVVSPGFVRSNLRGPSEEARSGWGEAEAGDPEVSGEIVLSVVQGKRDADVGGFIYKDGIHPW
ncbi:hypothetical protein V1517DRAFT_47934 [Lipomyces orientalis]|uniref:Uncharacterized protein n=1 Tax=Lipomyces orientalis TaxID=1233043 RepID=A0ACC3TEM6_9ASCO